MTCFNPKYVHYTTTYAVKPKLEQKIIENYHNNKNYDTYRKLIIENSKITKKIQFQTRKNFDTTKIGNGAMIIPCRRCLRLQT